MWMLATAMQCVNVWSHVTITDVEVLSVKLYPKLMEPLFVGKKKPLTASKEYCIRKSCIIIAVLLVVLHRYVQKSHW